MEEVRRHWAVEAGRKVAPNLPDVCFPSRVPEPRRMGEVLTRSTARVAAPSLLARLVAAFVFDSFPHAR